MVETVEAPDVSHYRKIIAQRRANKDPLIVVRVEDLAALLDCYAHFADGRTRVRRKAKGVQA